MVSVVIPARNAAATIGRTLDALATQDLRDEYEVIVVDDGSEDETASLAERSRGPVSVVRQAARGSAAARNRGAEVAAGAVLAFTDADCMPDARWLSAGSAALRDADLVQGRVVPEPGVDRSPFDRSLTVDRETGLFETANLLVSRELFDRIGGFESWLVPDVGKEHPLGEDLWFGWRARRAGARTTFCEAALVHHVVFPRGARSFIAERRRLRHFADIARKAPEIRSQLFFARYFLTRRSASFDLALLGVIGAAATGSRAPLALLLPYAGLVLRRSVRWRTRAPWVIVVGVVADAVGFADLLRGSLRRRTLVL